MLRDIADSQAAARTALALALHQPAHVSTAAGGGGPGSAGPGTGAPGSPRSGSMAITGSRRGSGTNVSVGSGGAAPGVLTLSAPRPIQSGSNASLGGLDGTAAVSSPRGGHAAAGPTAGAPVAAGPLEWAHTLLAMADAPTFIILDCRWCRLLGCVRTCALVLGPLFAWVLGAGRWV